MHNGFMRYKIPKVFAMKTERMEQNSYKVSIFFRKILRNT